MYISAGKFPNQNPLDMIPFWMKMMNIDTLVTKTLAVAMMSPKNKLKYDLIVITFLKNGFLSG